MIPRYSLENLGPKPRQRPDAPLGGTTTTSPLTVPACLPFLAHNLLEGVHHAVVRVRAGPSARLQLPGRGVNESPSDLVVDVARPRHSHARLVGRAKGQPLCGATTSAGTDMGRGTLTTSSGYMTRICSRTISHAPSPRRSRSHHLGHAGDGSCPPAVSDDTRRGGGCAHRDEPAIKLSISAKRTWAVSGACDWASPRREKDAQGQTDHKPRSTS